MSKTGGSAATPTGAPKSAGRSTLKQLSRAVHLAAQSSHLAAAGDLRRAHVAVRKAAQALAQAELHLARALDSPTN